MSLRRNSFGTGSVRSSGRSRLASAIRQPSSATRTTNSRVAPANGTTRPATTMAIWSRSIRRPRSLDRQAQVVAESVAQLPPFSSTLLEAI